MYQLWTAVRRERKKKSVGKKQTKTLNIYFKKIDFYYIKKGSTIKHTENNSIFEIC